MSPRAAWSAALAIAAADSALAAGGARRARWVTKPALVPAIALAARSGGMRPSRTLDVALAGSSAGDVALLSRSEAGLLGGVGGFALAHFAYLAEIRRRASAPPSSAPAPPGDRAIDAGAPGGPATDASAPGGPAADAGAAGRVATGAFAAVFAGAAAVLWRRLDTPAERRLRGPVVGYAALVTGMGAAAVRTGLRAGGPGGRALALGGATFVVSDALVALRQFGPRRSRVVEAAVMVTYAAAQALLVKSLAPPGHRPRPAHRQSSRAVSGRGRPRGCAGRARPRPGGARCRWSPTAR